jgi:hypothetical protein
VDEFGEQLKHDSNRFPSLRDREYDRIRHIQISDGPATRTDSISLNGSPRHRTYSGTYTLKADG